MAIDIVTKEDLQHFRHQLLSNLKDILQASPQEKKEWLKSYEVRKLLKISPGTLQNLRINGTLSYTKVGSIIYYAYQDIEKLMEVNSSHNSQRKNPLGKSSLFKQE